MFGHLADDSAKPQTFDKRFIRSRCLEDQAVVGTCLSPSYQDLKCPPSSFGCRGAHSGRWRHPRVGLVNVSKNKIINQLNFRSCPYPQTHRYVPQKNLPKLPSWPIGKSPHEWALCRGWRCIAVSVRATSPPPPMLSTPQTVFHESSRSTFAGCAALRNTNLYSVAKLTRTGDRRGQTHVRRLLSALSKYFPNSRSELRSPTRWTRFFYQGRYHKV